MILDSLRAPIPWQASIAQLIHIPEVSLYQCTCMCVTNTAMRNCVQLILPQWKMIPFLKSYHKQQEYMCILCTRMLL